MLHSNLRPMDDKSIPAAYSVLYRSKKFADVQICIAEDPDNTTHLEQAVLDSRSRLSSQTAKKVDVFPGHRLILWHGSEFFRAKLDNWMHNTDIDASSHKKDQHTTAAAVSLTSPSAASTPVITLSVPTGQLHAGQLLIRCLYEAGSPNFKLNQLPQQQLLQLLLLADRCSALPIAMAAAAALGSIKSEDMKWAAVVKLHELQQQFHTLSVLPGYSAALAAASHKLYTVLGDLEVAWQHAASASILRQLPFSLLHQLLSDDCTRVACEDTVVYTVNEWIKHQAAAAGLRGRGSTFVLDQQTEQLVQLIRLPYCSPLFLITVVPNARWLMQHITPAELATAAVTAQQRLEPGVRSFPLKAALSARSSVMARREAWRLPARPSSAVNNLLLELTVPLQQLRLLVEGQLQCALPSQTLQGDCGVHVHPAAAAVPIAAGIYAEAAVHAAPDYSSIDSEPVMWQGREFYLKMQMSGSRRLMVSLSMHPMTTVQGSEGRRGMCESAEGAQQEQEIAVVLCSMCAVRFGGAQEVCRKAKRYRTIVAGGKGYTWTDFFGLGEVYSWASVKTGLITKHQMAIGAGSILIRAKVMAIL